MFWNHLCCDMMFAIKLVNVSTASSSGDSVHACGENTHIQLSNHKYAVWCNHQHVYVRLQDLLIPLTEPLCSLTKSPRYLCPLQSTFQSMVQCRFLHPIDKWDHALCFFLCPAYLTEHNVSKLIFIVTSPRISFSKAEWKPVFCIHSSMPRGIVSLSWLCAWCHSEYKAPVYFEILTCSFWV